MIRGVESAIVTEGLSKRFRARVAVDALDLNVDRGLIFGFLGPNGAGKTTTIRMLLGLAKPTSGRVRLLDQELPGELHLAIQKVGSVLEDPAFYPTMSALDNLKVLARVASEPAALNRAEPLLERLGLADRGRDKVGKFSRGMRQRLALAAAMLRDPDLLILDEPATGLDPPGVRDIRDLLVELRQQGKTIFLSSHSLSEVEKVCDEVAILREGRVVAAGSLESLVTNEQVSVRVVVDDLGAGLDLARSKAWEAEIEGGAVVIRHIPSDEVNAVFVSAGIRPKELSVTRRGLEDLFMELTEESGE